MNIERDMVTVNGADLYYETAGSGQPLVLLHGFSLDRRMWDDQLAIFAEQYRVIRYDLRGFGRSAVPEGRSYAHADDLKAMLEQLGIRGAHLVGLSLGGWVAVNFALAYPQSIRSLVLASPVLLGLEWSQAYLEATNPVWAAATQEGIEVGKALWLRTPLFAQAMAIPKAARRLSEIVGDYSGWHLVNSDPGRVVPDVLARLETIMAPTLVLAGEQDFSDFRRIADTLLQIPGARKVVLPGIGHMLNMEDPPTFNHLVLTFLAEIQSDGTGG